MLTYLLGPFLSIFPKPWRKSLPFAESVDWAPSTVISGLVELVGGIIAIAYWYLYAMTTWVDRIVDAALSGKLGAGTTVQAVGSVALVVWITHPLTWLLAYVGVEGAVRLCGAAFTNNILGTLPLFLLDKVFVGPFRRRGSRDVNGSPVRLTAFPPTLVPSANEC